MARLPESIGKYKIIALLAKGGMGAVYKAEHPTLNRPVVIKKLTLRGNAGIRARFRREARIMMDFKSDYIVTVYDHFREGASYHIVQEFVDGLSVEELLERDRYLPESIALRIFLEASLALTYAHEKGVVHRDIKPGNILVSRNGNVKLVDFGIAAIRDEEGENALTRDGMTLGTPSYMAPEQFNSSRDVDYRADIYSLGVMLYEMVTGKKPFPGSVSPETLRLIQKGKYSPPRGINPGISPFVQRLIRRLMHANVLRRPKVLNTVNSRVRKHLSRSVFDKGYGKEPRLTAALLSACVTGERTEPPGKKFSGKSMAAGAAAAVLLFGILTAGVRTGYHRELFSPGRYAPFSVTVEMKNGDTPGGGATVRSRLYREGNHEEIRLWRMPGFDLPGQAADREKAALRYKSLPRYLPAGEYRLETTVLNQVYVNTFLLLSGGGGREITIRHRPPEPVSFRMSIRIFDAVSGIDLTGTAASYIRTGGRWSRMDPAGRITLPAGTDHLIRFTHAGYYSREYELPADPVRTHLGMEAALLPLPGALRVISGLDGVRLLINGEEQYLSGGRKPENLPLPALDPGEPVDLLLPPGRYTLGAYVTRGSEMEIRVRVEALKRQIIRIETDETAGTIRIITGALVSAPGLGE